MGRELWSTGREIAVRVTPTSAGRLSSKTFTMSLPRAKRSSGARPLGEVPKPCPDTTDRSTTSRSGASSPDGSLSSENTECPVSEVPGSSDRSQIRVLPQPPDSSQGNVPIAEEGRDMEFFLNSTI